jgi:TRAP-type C4-dicarboxylate transport system permease small subunit
VSAEDDAPPPRDDALAPLARAAFALGGLALVALVGVEAWQVLARYVLNASPGWTEPTALLLLTGAMSLGAAGAVHQGAHFGFFILRERAPAPVRRALELMSELVVAALGAVLAYGSGRLLLDGLDVPMAGTFLPASANHAPMCVAGALMTLFALDRARRRVARAPAAEP